MAGCWNAVIRRRTARPSSRSGSIFSRARIAAFHGAAGRRQVSEPILPSFSVEGQVALVTGASSGIGLHLAEILALAGAKVAVAARRVDRLEAACEAIRSRGGTCLPVALDVTRK